MRARLASSLFVCLLLFSYARPSRAAEHELVAASGGGALASTWRGDVGPYAPMRLGYRWHELVSLDVIGRLGYAPVDHRMLTYVSLSASAWGHLGRAQPYARVALVHQHEESSAAIATDPGGAVFGVGNGIRHRGGYAAALGFHYPVRQEGKLGAWFVGLDAGATYFPDDRGPSWYFGGSAWLGFALDVRGGT